MPRAQDRNSTIFVFMTVTLDSVGIGIIMPVMPDLMQELSGLSVGGAAIWGGYLAFSYALAQFLFSPTLGNLSDRFGRRPVLLISLLTMAIDYLIMALAPTLWVLFLGRVLAGVSGATYSTANAYIADVTPKDKRAGAFGLLGAAFGVGFILGPAIGGLMGEFGTRAPFYAAAAVAALNFAFGWWVFPESLPLEKRRGFEWRRANPLGAFRQLRQVPMVAWLVAAYFLFGLSHHVYPSVWSYFTTAKFDWTEAEIGLSLAAVGLCFAVVQGGLIKPILKRLGEIRTAVMGIVLSAIGMLAFAVATEPWMIYALIPLTAVGAVATPALTGLMANRVPDDAQGELQGVLGSCSAVVVILSPLAMTQLFGAFTREDAGIYFPGAPFVAGAFLMALVLVPFWIGVRERHN